MTASDHISRRQFKHLYHGTDAELSEGEVVSPERARGDAKVVYTATAPRFARHFGDNVYMVEPVGQVDPPRWMPQYAHDDPRMVEVTSSEGFRVVKKVKRKRQQ